ncbi:hypothetical protein [Mycobacterium vicinigordonae]|uniref:Uncharacterized protein n=1 Tax=Mycobacterium vicinigordonae TaxID=1719132 RepID=A0A7D6DWD6_9MYCO|nr:hypothetical protein [Mycobacterium vicinigordonae]QLL05490.1 hypothetical protein H0P51_16670 [Mycobacterium vicinigordonae]
MSYVLIGQEALAAAATEVAGSAPSSGNVPAAAVVRVVGAAPMETAASTAPALTVPNSVSRDRVAGSTSATAQSLDTS